MSLSLLVANLRIDNRKQDIYHALNKMNKKPIKMVIPITSE
ncbi:hypothetical protein JCM19236_1522 [Vibrio sp. JCM 19236]|nr:hypothetical protein JCM19236_1522 [Vibrio sp. JCM 19236]